MSKTLKISILVLITLGFLFLGTEVRAIENEPVVSLVELFEGKSATINGNTITLTEDVVFGTDPEYQMLEITGGDCVLDLNGYSLKAGDIYFYSGKTTIKDTKGTGRINANCIGFEEEAKGIIENGIFPTIFNSATLTINNGTINTIYNTGTLTIVDGKFYKLSQGGTATIEGGKFIAQKVKEEGMEPFDNPSDFNLDCKTTLTGGEFVTGEDVSAAIMLMSSSIVDENSISKIAGEGFEINYDKTQFLNDPSNENIGYYGAIKVVPVYENYSETFKKLTTDGNIVITSTTLGHKYDLINNYISLFTNDEFHFSCENINQDATECTVVLSKIKKDNGEHVEIERHNVKIKYEEKYSDEFKKLTPDGNIVIKASRDYGKAELIDYYCSAFYRKDEVYFWKNHLNEECTECTIILQDCETGKDVESHVVKISYDKSGMSDDFKKVLNKDGKFEVKSVVPKDKEFWANVFDVVYKTKINMNWQQDYVAEDFSACDLTIIDSKGYPETHRVEIVFNYDKAIEKRLQGFINNFPNSSPDNITYFYVRDLELVNYWINNVGEDYAENLDAYSGEFKEAVSNWNVNYYVDNRAGFNDPFSAGRMGIAIFKYDDVVYYLNRGIATRADYVIYVPDETGNSEEELRKAAQKRINEYIGKQGVVTLTYSETTVEEENLKFWYPFEKEHREVNGLEYISLEDYIREESKKEYEDYGKEVLGIDGINENDYTFKANVKVGDKEKSFIIIIKKDSSKMVNPSYKVADMETNIEISTSDTSVPLDTSVRAEKVTGDEYERIIKELKEKIKISDANENLMFDLRLYSESLEDYIRKLPNGEFEVRIPISKEFQAKDLMAYYYDEDNEKVQEYKITKKDGYAIFKTNHFSIYTLAEAKVEDNTGDDNIDINQTYKLILDANEGKFPDGKTRIEFEDITKCDITKIEKPAKVGYIFKGWYTEKAGGISIETVMSSEEGIKEDTTFYAQWEKISAGGGESGIPEGGEQEDNNNTGNTNTGNTNTGNTNTGENNNATTGKNPQTGDNIVMFTVISLIAFVGIIVAIKIKNILNNN